MALSPLLSVGHAACQLNTLDSPTGGLVRASQRWQQLERAHPYVRAIASRTLLLAVFPTATCEALVHFTLGVGILAAGLGKRITVLALATLSWVIAVAHIFVMRWLLDVSKVNWVVRIMTEIGVLITRPWMFVTQWKERISVIFWASTRDRWIWHVSNQVEAQFQQFLELEHGLHHLEKALALTKAAVTVPVVGVVNPNRARRRFAALGIMPQSHVERFFHNHGGKIAVFAAVAFFLAIDYGRREAASPQDYVEKLTQAGEPYVKPHWEKGRHWTQWFGKAVYDQIFYERVDNSLINRRNRAVAEAAEIWTDAFKAGRLDICAKRTTAFPWAVTIS